MLVVIWWINDTNGIEVVQLVHWLWDGRLQGAGATPVVSCRTACMKLPPGLQLHWRTNLTSELEHVTKPTGVSYGHGPSRWKRPLLLRRMVCVRSEQLFQRDVITTHGSVHVQQLKGNETFYITKI